MKAARSRLAFNGNGLMTSTCKWNTSKLKNVANEVCIKTAINAQLKKINRGANSIKEINRLT